MSKDELLTRVWPSLVVEENNLTVQVSALRKVLGPGAITTVAGRGYRFTLPLLDGPAVGGAADGAQRRALDTGSVSAAPPAPQAFSAAPTNLPAERSSFIGREQETALLRQLLNERRLITLTGIGGSGKTRLALRFGALELAAIPLRFPDGVFFVDLAPLADPDLAAPTLAAACGLAPGDSPPGVSRSFVERLVSALAPRRALLLLDNCEHLLDSAAELAEALLAGCPQLVLLVTSREALGVEGEHVVLVPSLAVPDESAPEVVTEAMRLFADRAQAAQSSFRLDEQTLPAVAEICRRLDGIPLAIEFAAARVSHLSAAQVAERLGDRFRLLTGGRRRVARQQTLAAALDWSHDLLSDQEQILFRRLAVFAGGFSLSAAEGVCAEDLPGQREVLDHLGSLVAKSLVTVGRDEHAEMRYRLLETVRLYALDKLAAAGEEVAWRTRHRDHFARWLDGVPLEALWQDGGAIDATALEIDNLRVAFDGCVAEGSLDVLVRMVTRVGGYWLSGQGYREAIRYLRTALHDEDLLAAPRRVAAHAMCSTLSILARDVEAALRHASEGIEAAETQGPPSGADEELFGALAWSYRGFALATLAAMPGAAADMSGRARHDLDEGLRRYRGLPSGFLALAQLGYGFSELNMGSLAEASRWLAAASDGSNSDGTRPLSRVAALAGLATARHLSGDTQGALEAALRCQAEHEASGRRWPMDEGYAVEVTPALWVGGETERALAGMRRAAAAMQRNGVDLAPNQFLCVAAVIEVQRGRPERAARLFAAARAVGGADQAVVSFRTPMTSALYMHYRPLAQSALSREQAHRLREEGRAMTLDEAFDDALAGLSLVGG